MTDDLIATFNGLAEAYPADVWPPLTQEEAVEIHRTHPGFVDRVSAAMGRFFGPRFREAATALADRDAQIERLTRERKDFIQTISEWATKAGEAEGRLAASEWPGVVEGWKDRATAAERERDEARAEVERKDAALAPFADMADYIDAETEGVSDADEVDVMFHDFLFARWPISHFRCARAALTAKGGENAEG